MANESKNRQLKNILIDAPFQIRLLSYFAVLFIVTSISFYSTIFLFFYRLAQTGHKIGIPVGHVFYKFLDQEKSDLDLLFTLLMFVNFGLLIGCGFIISHRIAGPISKLRGYLANLNSGSAPFALRKKDFFKDLEPVVNELRGKIK